MIFLVLLAAFTGWFLGRYLYPSEALVLSRLDTAAVADEILDAFDGEREGAGPLRPEDMRRAIVRVLRGRG